MDRKFFEITFFLLVGIISSYYLMGNILKLSLVVIIFISIGLFIDLKNREKRLIISSLFIFLGIFIVFSNLKTSRLLKLRDKDLLVGGMVSQIESGEEKQKILLRVDRINKTSISKEDILLTYRGKENFSLGDRLVVSLSPRLANENTNPKLFNYRQHLLSKKIYVTSQIKDGDIHFKEGSRSWAYRMKNGFKTRVESSLEDGFNKRNKDLLKSIILGENYLMEEDLNLYRDLGLGHILAASGLHIGIIALSLEFVFGLLKTNKNLNRIIILSFLWFYGFLINFPLSILRANIMISIYYLSMNLCLPYDYKNTIFFTMTCLLIWNPFAIFSLSFILSFAAVISLAYISPILEAWLTRYIGEFARLVGPILGVNLGLLPITTYYFNNFQPLSIISNIVVVPLISLVLNLAVVLVIFANNLLFLKLILNLVLNFKFFIIDILSIVNKNITMFSPNIEEILIFYLFIFILLYFYKNKDLIRETAGLTLLLSSLYGLVFIYGAYFREELQINFVDVGQGDFTHINYKNKNYIIDTGGEVFGNFSIGQNISLPYLVKHNISSLEAVFISHFHEDHSRALEDLLGEIKIDNLFISYIPENNRTYGIVEKNLKPRLLKAGDKVNLANDLKFYVISPAREYLDENNKSMVGVLTYRNFKGLFTGDMELEVERDLLLKNIGKMDLIKVPHHGSKTSSSLEFLEKIRPSLAIFSVGRNNRFNHPNEEVVERYQAINSKIYKTSRSGRINVKIGRKLRVSGYLTRKKLGYREIFYYYIVALLLINYIDKYLRTRKYFI